ncbi:MAG: SLC13 family permease, partial [Candidatus Nanopelagicales bacterium]|nr:SLC13 family permease [Candidatus Nanopelagicales bacterium]
AVENVAETRKVRRPLARLAVPVAGASAFLNNTPIMAMLIPQLQAWADRRRLSVSKLLMPVSFITVLGGMLTLIGTSTNLVVNGLMVESGIGELGFFEIGKVGLPVAVVGLIAVVLLAPRVLPARRSVKDELTAEARHFYVEMIVVSGGPIDHKTVEDAGLRDLAGVFLVSVHRTSGPVIAPVNPDTQLRGGDRLRFAGQVNKVLDLQERRGLKSAELEHVTSLDDPAVRYYEAVIGTRSPLVGRTLREAGFRATYQSAVVAIHRDGELVHAQLGRVPLRVGDTLVLVSDPGFKERWSDREDFLLISPVDDAAPLVATSRAWIPPVLLGLIVFLAALGVVPILVGALIGAVLLVLTRVLSSNEAMRAVDLEVIVIIAAAFGLAAAMETTGLAEVIASGLVSATGGLGERGALLGLVLATIVLTEMITNNAAAMLMFPIGLTIAAQTGLNPVGVAVAIALCASASFLTPIGYQTNTMVYGPGGYRFGDYSRLGLPLTVIVATMTIWLVPVMWP